MVDRSEFLRWREAADSARQSAELQAGARLYNWACFLAEQGAQLAIKGLLHGIGAGAWGHDLVVLGRALTDHAGAAVPAEVTAALRRLARHYIPARYPDAHPSGAPGAYYGREDADQALADLATVLQHVDQVWSALFGPAAGDPNGR